MLHDDKTPSIGASAIAKRELVSPASGDEEDFGLSRDSAMDRWRRLWPVRCVT